MDSLPTDTNNSSQNGIGNTNNPIPTFSAGPEMPPIQETPAKEESLFSLEDLPSPENPNQTKTTDENLFTPVATAPLIDSSEIKKEPTIVDETEKITQLHTLSKTTDDLTIEADKEEEEFIEEVERHHGNLK